MVYSSSSHAGGTSMELTDSLKTLFMETAQALQGSARRLFRARTVKERGPGGQRCAERELGWNRGTLRKGTHELESGFTCLDAFSARGRKRVETHLQQLLPRGVRSSHPAVSWCGAVMVTSALTNPYKHHRFPG